MKLLTKSTFYFFLISIVVMIAGGTSLYFVIRIDLYNQIDNSLITEKEIIQNQIEQTSLIPDFSVLFGHKIEVKKINYPAPEAEGIKDTVLIDINSGEKENYRYFFYSGNIKNGGYTIRIFEILSEKQDLLEAISIYIVGLLLALLVLTILINYLISKKLWSPFYLSVEKALNFDVLSDSPLDLPESDILEFRELNEVLERMTLKMRTDYLNLKEYNENAAHEVQTPLAIIRSKVELLLQQKYLNKEGINLIKSIDEATTRLYKLNQGLLLISKIENQYFQENVKISLREIVETSLENYKEILEIKGIRVDIKGSSRAYVQMNEVLAEVLVSNLLSNAVRYNIENGYIECRIDDDFISIRNSGLPLKGEPEMLFQRFHKGSDNPQSVGLGLSIVKKITDNYNMKITYIYSGTVHELKLSYKTRPSI